MASTASSSSPKEQTSVRRPQRHHKKAVPIRMMPLEDAQPLPSPTNEFQCSHCSETFDYKSSLIIHEMSHKRMTTCGVCSKQVFMENLGEHLKTHHENQPPPQPPPPVVHQNLLECDLCPKTCTHKIEMAIHMVSYHQRTRKRRNVEKKQKIEETPETFECLICHKIFAALAIVRRHVKLHSEAFEGEKFRVVREKERKEFEGQVMKNGKLGRKLRNELKTASVSGIVTLKMNTKSGEKENEGGEENIIHTLKPPKPQPDVNLDPSTSVKIITKSSSIPPPPQEVTEKLFEIKLNCGKPPTIIQASNKELPIVEKSSDPSKAIETALELLKHEMNVKVNVKSEEVDPLIKSEPQELQVIPDLPCFGDQVTNRNLFFCDLCPRTFEEKFSLEIHLNCSHGYKRVFRCKVCPFKTTKLITMKFHRQIHKSANNVKRFGCEVCGCEYSTKRALEEHRVAKHTEGKDFPCEICGKYFKTMTYVKRHIKTTHAGDNKFQCSFCKKSFGTRNELNKHIGSLWRIGKCSTHVKLEDENFLRGLDS